MIRVRFWMTVCVILCGCWIGRLRPVGPLELLGSGAPLGAQSRREDDATRQIDKCARTGCVLWEGRGRYSVTRQVAPDVFLT